MRQRDAGATVADHVAAGDCERCRPGPVAQPVNTVSSLAYVVSGVGQLRAAGRAGSAGRRSERALAWATVSAGIGSVAYHGPGRVLGRYVHDASLVATLALLAVADAELLTGREVPAPALALVPVAAALAAHPTTSMSVQAVTGAVVGGLELARARTEPHAGPRTRQGELAAIVVGLAAHVGGGRGGPFCRPESRLQPHAVWHALTATTLWLRATEVSRAVVPLGA